MRPSECHCLRWDKRQLGCPMSPRDVTAPMEARRQPGETGGVVAKLPSLTHFQRLAGTLFFSLSTALLLSCSSGVGNQLKNPIIQTGAPWVQITSQGPSPRFAQMAVL